MSQDIRESQPYSLPESWEAMPSGEREDYDFRIEFNESVGEQEKQAVISLIEAAPRILGALEAMLVKFDFGEQFPIDHPILAARDAIAAATGKEAV